MPSDGSSVILDTSVVSLLVRDADAAAYYWDEIGGRRAVISFQIRGEALFGAIGAGRGARRMNELLQHLDRCEAVWSTPELVEVSARLRDERERTGRKLNTADAWVAATAMWEASGQSSITTATAPTSPTSNSSGLPCHDPPRHAQHTQLRPTAGSGAPGVARAHACAERGTGGGQRWRAGACSRTYAPPRPRSAANRGAPPRAPRRHHDRRRRRDGGVGHDCR